MIFLTLLCIFASPAFSMEQQSTVRNRAYTFNGKGLVKPKSLEIKEIKEEADKDSLKQLSALSKISEQLPRPRQQSITEIVAENKQQRDRSSTDSLDKYSASSHEDFSAEGILTAQLINEEQKVLEKAAVLQNSQTDLRKKRIEEREKTKSLVQETREKIEKNSKSQYFSDSSKTEKQEQNQKINTNVIIQKIDKEKIENNLKDSKYVKYEESNPKTYSRSNSEKSLNSMPSISHDISKQLTKGLMSTNQLKNGNGNKAEEEHILQRRNSEKHVSTSSKNNNPQQVMLEEEKIAQKSAQNAFLRRSNSDKNIAKNSSKNNEIKSITLSNYSSNSNELVKQATIEESEEKFGQVVKKSALITFNFRNKSSIKTPAEMLNESIKELNKEKFEKSIAQGAELELQQVKDLCKKYTEVKKTPKKEACKDLLKIAFENFGELTISELTETNGFLDKSIEKLFNKRASLENYYKTVISDKEKKENEQALKKLKEIRQQSLAAQISDEQVKKAVEFTKQERAYNKTLNEKYPIMPSTKKHPVAGYSLRDLVERYIIDYAPKISSFSLKNINSKIVADAKNKDLFAFMKKEILKKTRINIYTIKPNIIQQIQNLPSNTPTKRIH